VLPLQHALHDDARAVQELPPAGGLVGANQVPQWPARIPAVGEIVVVQVGSGQDLYGAPGDVPQPSFTGEQGIQEQPLDPGVRPTHRFLCDRPRQVAVRVIPAHVPQGVQVLTAGLGGVGVVVAGVHVHEVPRRLQAEIPGPGRPAAHVFEKKAVRSVVFHIPPVAAAFSVPVAVVQHAVGLRGLTVGVVGSKCPVNPGVVRPLRILAAYGEGAQHTGVDEQARVDAHGGWRRIRLHRRQGLRGVRTEREQHVMRAGHTPLQPVHAALQVKVGAHLLRATLRIGDVAYIRADANAQSVGVDLPALGIVLPEIADRYGQAAHRAGRDQVVRGVDAINQASLAVPQREAIGQRLAERECAGGQIRRR